MNCIVQISIDRGERSKSQGYKYSEKAWKYWADKNNVKYLTITDDFLPQVNPAWFKSFIPAILKDSGIDFDQVLYVDSDTLVHPDMPNIFNFSDRKFTVVRNFGSMDWVCRSVEVYNQLFPEIKLSPFEYFNSGLIIFNESHSDFFKKCSEYYLENHEKLNNFNSKYYVGRDQPILNYFIKKENIPVKFLPYEFNMQDMHRFEIITNDFLFTKYGWIYHFNAGVKPSPGYWMEYTYLNYIKKLQK